MKHSLDYVTSHAKQLRKDTLQLSLDSGHAHLGGCLSSIEILTTLYDEVLDEKDTFVLSKGHACLPYYLLLREQGFDPEILGHPDRRPEQGIYATTGSLGHGLPIATGMAFARKLQQKEGGLYVLMSDGECQEGTTWESADIAAAQSLNNLTVIVDYNKIQATDYICNVRHPEDNLCKKFDAFGWDVHEVDGHDIPSLVEAFQIYNSRPLAIIAHTTKGKGVSYMENDPVWHGKKPTPERLTKAFEELA